MSENVMEGVNMNEEHVVGGAVDCCYRTESNRKSGVGKVAITVLAAFFMAGSLVKAADAALDDASSGAYTDITNFEGINGGAGFGAWQNYPTENSDVNGLFIGDSNSNGDGSGPGINSAGDVAFGLYANSGEVALAVRAFSGDLVVGQSFYVDIDTGTLEGDDSLQSFSLQDADGETRFELFIRTGSSSYLLNDGEGEFSTEFPVTSGGLRIAITITSEDTYDISLTELASGNNTSFSGRLLGGISGAGIARAQFYHFNNSANSGPEGALFVNFLEVSCVTSLECSITQVGGSNPGTPDSQNIYVGPEEAQTFTWYLENNNTGAFIEGPDNQQSVVVNNGSGSGTYELALQYTANDCDDVCAISVEVGSTPAPEAGNNSPICAGADLILTATDIENATYTWVGPDLFLSTDQNPVIIQASTAAEGEYSVSASVNGSPSPVSTTYVTVVPAPECLIGGTEVICPGTEQEIYFAPNDLTSYQWEIEGNAVIESEPNNGIIRVIPEESGSFTLTLTIENESGCVSVCVKTVTIGDEEGPVLECPVDASLSIGEDFSPDALGFATAVDNCDAEPVVTYEDNTVPGECTGSLLVTRTWTATDAYGNSSTCDQTISIGDSEIPLLEVPADANLNCGSDTSPEALGYPNVVDNVDPNPVVNYVDEVFTIDCSNQYVIQRLWTAEDSCGNLAESFQVITVDDLSKPDMVVPADVSVTLDADVSPEALGFATATDNCDSEPVISYFDEILEGECASEYTIQRFWSAQDSCGNLTEITQNITVGNGPVELTIPADSVVECSGDTSPEALGFATAVDGSGQEVAVSYEDETITADCNGRYIILRTWSAEDACGRVVDATQTIVIDDLTAPVLELPADATVSCDGDTSPESLGFASATDNCDGAPVVSYSDSVVSGDSPSQSSILRLWSALDECGNVAQSVQTITVEDTTAPVLSIPSDALVNCGDDTSVEALGEATAEDNCDDAPVVSHQDTIVDGACAGSYTIERVWTAADAGGNISEATQVISVSDGTAPVLTVPADVTVGCGESSDPDVTGTATASDDCSSPVTVTYADEVQQAVIVRTWTAIDACGNEASAPQVITSSGGGSGSAPVITSPGDQIVFAGCDEPVDFVEPTATSDCDPNVVITYTTNKTSGGSNGHHKKDKKSCGRDLDAGVHVIKATATDSSGNSSSITFKVTVLRPLRVVFQSSLDDDNVANNIETDKDKENKFKAGSTVPHKIKLYDCNNRDVTDKVGDLVNVRLDVSLRVYNRPSTTSTLVQDLPENYSGEGRPGGLMEDNGSSFQYNLKTKSYPNNTSSSAQFIRSRVTVEYKSLPGVIAGEEDALLESKK